MAVKNKVLTLAFIRESCNVLLGYKKRGFGVDLWNGFGGKVQAGETIEEGAKRELLEESGLVASHLDKVGLLMFEFLGDPQLLEVHVFSTTKFQGVPSESDEMRPQWYNINKVPYENMWPDDILWFPYLLNNKHFCGYFKFKGMDDIVDHYLTEVKDLSSVRIPLGPLTSCNICT